MAMNQALTNTPTALASTTAATDYTLQCQGSYKMYVQIASTAPSASSNSAFVVGSMSYATAKHNSGESIFVWQDEAPAYGRVVYDESA